MRKVLTVLGFLMVLGMMAQPPQGSFTVRKHRCIPDSVRKAIDQTDQSWPGQDIAAVSGTLWAGDSTAKVFVARATILIYKQDSLFAYTRTNNEGRYTIYLPVGDYRLETCRNGYRTTSQTVKPRRKVPFTYDVDLETVLTRNAESNSIPEGARPTERDEGSFVEAQTEGRTPRAPGRLRGTISLINNDFPQSEIEVRLYQGDTLIQSVYCDEKGYYNFGGLDNGLYDVIILTDRENSPLPNVPIERGKIKILDIRLTRRGKIKD